MEMSKEVYIGFYEEVWNVKIQKWWNKQSWEQNYVMYWRIYVKLVIKKLTLKDKHDWIPIQSHNSHTAKKTKKP